MGAQSTVPSTREEVRANFFVSLCRELRPKQWSKNVLVFASAIFAGKLLDPSTLLNAIYSFISFSLMASTIYIINDILDVERDRVHPDKRHRPIASGAISVFQGVMLAICTFILSVYLSTTISVNLTIVIIVYFILNLFYSIRLKHIVIVDVMIIAMGFVLRSVAGAVAVDGVVTSWFILCTLLLSLFLALGKRRHELELFADSPENRRRVLEFYSVKLLDQLMTIVTGLAIMFYAMYAASSKEQGMMYTIPFVIYGIFRYFYLVHMENAGGKPEEVLINDKHILITVILFGGSVVYIKQFL